jgi:hypothetical protein
MMSPGNTFNAREVLEFDQQVQKVTGKGGLLLRTPSMMVWLS